MKEDSVLLTKDEVFKILNLVYAFADENDNLFFWDPSDLEEDSNIFVLQHFYSNERIEAYFEGAVLKHNFSTLELAVRFHLTMELRPLILARKEIREIINLTCPQRKEKLQS